MNDKKFEKWASANGFNVEIANSGQFKGTYKIKFTRLLYDAWATAWQAGFGEGEEAAKTELGIDCLCELGDLDGLPITGSLKGLELVGYGSWRGEYDKPCLYIVQNPDAEITPQQLKDAKDALLSQSFYGYKGGEYRYTESDIVYIEQANNRCTYGGYIKQLARENADFRTLCLV